jgi:DNA-binding NarL/FixJ family response regulator
MAKKKTAVIVDTDDNSSSFLKTILFQMQFTDINKTIHTQEAIDFLSGKKASYLFLKVDMPDIPGQEAVSKIRETNKKTKIILMADDKDSNDVRSAMEAGANGVLGRPFNAMLVQKTLQNAKKLT